MVIEDSYLPLEEVRRHPLFTSIRGGEPVSSAALDRWISRGVNGVRLESVRLGRRRGVSVDAMKRFIAAMSGEPAGEPPAISPAATTKATSRRASRLRKALARKRPRHDAGAAV